MVIWVCVFSLLEFPWAFVVWKSQGFSITQLLGQRNFSGLFLFVWVGWFSVRDFPVDNEKILLLGRQNPALTRFQSSSTAQFIRQTRMVHIKKSIFSSCFSILVIVPILPLYAGEDIGRRLSLAWGTPQGLFCHWVFPVPNLYLCFSAPEVGRGGGGRCPGAEGRLVAAPCSWLWYQVGSSHGMWYNSLAFFAQMFVEGGRRKLLWRKNDQQLSLGMNSEEEMVNQHGSWSLWAGMLSQENGLLH